jgi:SHS2 domain-containing protein
VIPETPPRPSFTLDVEADTPKDLFEQLAHRLVGRMVNQEDVGEALREKLQVEAPDLEALLKEWVLGILQLMHQQKMVFGRFALEEVKNPKKGSFFLRADVIGELFDPQRHVLTYPAGDLVLQKIRLTQTPRGYQAQATFAL